MIFIKPLPFLLLVMSLSTHASFDWLAMFQKTNNLSDVYDHYQATEVAWRDDSDYKYSLTSFTPSYKNDLSSKLCGSRFYPAHPMASTKLYHFAKYKRYIAQKIPASSYSCRTRSNGSRKYCLAAGSLKFAILSDTFFDSCGRYFRGFWPVAYNSDHESLGTLLAKGRTVRPKPNSVFSNDYIPSNTYEVQRSNFIYMSPLFKGDAAKINEAVRSASKFYKIKMKNNIFIEEAK